MFVRDSLNVIRINDLDEYFQPSIYCKISNDASYTSLAVLYRSPSLSDEQSSKMITFFDKFCQDNANTNNAYLMGDFRDADPPKAWGYFHPFLKM